MNPAVTISHNPPFPQTIAIIGASISGLSLALALLQANLFSASTITIYDLRGPPSSSSSSSSPSSPYVPHATQSGFNPSTTASGIILTPNGLSVLAHLGIFQRLRPHCWTATHRTFRSDPGDVLVKKVRISGEELGYGFENHRCWREVLVRELLEQVTLRGVEVRWGCRFEGVLADGKEVDGGGGGGSEKNQRVTFKISRAATAAVPVAAAATDGSGQERHIDTAHADMLVGADGIYSTVRRYVEPMAKPIYTGTTGVLAHIRWEDVDWPRVKSPTSVLSGRTSNSMMVPTETSHSEGQEQQQQQQQHAEYEHDYERQCTLQGTPGALFWLPEDPAGSVIMVAKQTRMSEPTSLDATEKEKHAGHLSTREAWETLSQDKQFLTSFFKDGYDDWGATGRKIIDAVCDEKRGRQTLYLWPFMRMERMERWFKLGSGSGSGSGQSATSSVGGGGGGNGVVLPEVVSATASTQNNTETNTDKDTNDNVDNSQGTILLMGDAAHALPPSSGQGVNQTLEDVYVLCQVLKLVANGRKGMGDALKFWQEVRQERVEEVFDWATGVTNVSRLSRVEREQERERDSGKEKGFGVVDGGGTKRQEKKADDMRWLYMPGWDEVIERWVAEG